MTSWIYYLVKQWHQDDYQYELPKRIMEKHGLLIMVICIELNGAEF